MDIEIRHFGTGLIAAAATAETVMATLIQGNSIALAGYFTSAFGFSFMVKLPRTPLIL
jgi:hypothetical protein